jgi:two-component system NtrC family sensor kinase
MNGNHYAPLKHKLLTSMLIVPAIPFIALLIIGYYFFVNSLQSTTVAKMNRVVEDHRQMIESFLQERLSDLRFLVESYNYTDIIKEEVLASIFNNLLKKSPAFTDIGVFNEAGLHVAYKGPYKLLGINYKETPWFRRVMEDGFYISDVFLGYRKVPHFIIAVTKKDKEHTWIIRSTIDSSLFSDVVEKIQIGNTGEAYILNKEGRFQTIRRSGGELMDKDSDLSDLLAIHSGVKIFEKNSGGAEYLYATTWLNKDHWLLVARIKKAEAFKNLHRLTYLVILVILFGGAMITSMAFFVTRRIIRRMERMDEEKNELGQQLIRAGRLAEIGEMSSGFAHEINSPLQNIIVSETLIDTILSDMREQGELKESEDLAQVHRLLGQIRAQVNRCGQVTQDLLKFARKQESQEDEIDLRMLVPEWINLVRRKAGVEGITIKEEISLDVPVIQADSSQLQQVIVNLLNNAIDAIIERHGASGGELIVILQPSTNGRVIMSVKDNGSGISPENMEKIFTPFFTTKPVGKGTGLGLPICYGIITKMGGTIDVSSEKGEGTTFIISL